MPTAKVTSKGQITVPVSVRRELGVKSGDLLAFEVRAGYVTVRRQDSLEEASAKIRELTRGIAPVYSDEDEAILSAFDDAADVERGEDIVLIRVSDEDLA